QHDFDGLLQLRVLPFHYQVGAILDHNVGLHAAVLHHPLAVEVVARGLGTRNVASIHKRYLAADATHSAPGAFADEGAEFVVLEVIAEYVTVRGSITIGHTGHGAVEYDWGNGVALPVANGAHAGQHAPQPGEDELVHKAAAVVAHVDNHSLFADLREVLFDEFIQPRTSHIREIDVADASVAGSINLFPIALDPGKFPQVEFIRHGLYLHGASAILGGFGIDGQSHIFVRRVHKELIRILRRTQRPAIDRNQIVARFDSYPGFGQGRAGLRVPVFARIDFLEAVHVGGLVRLEVHSQQAHIDRM